MAKAEVGDRFSAYEPGLPLRVSGIDHSCESEERPKLLVVWPVKSPSQIFKLFGQVLRGIATRRGADANNSEAAKFKFLFNAGLRDSSLQTGLVGRMVFLEQYTGAVVLLTVAFVLKSKVKASM